MIKNAIPWAMGVRHLQRHARVITEIAFFVHVIPDTFNGLRRHSCIHYSEGEFRTYRAIFGMAGKDRLAAEAAFFSAFRLNKTYGRHRQNEKNTFSKKHLLREIDCLL